MPTQLLYTITVLVWGSSWFAITLQLGPVHPMWSVAYRFAMAAALLLLFCIGSGRQLRFGPCDQVFLALQGLFLFSLNYILFYFVTQHLTSGVVAVTFSTIVFMNLVNGALIFRAPVSARVIVGAFLGLIGISLVFWPELRALDMSVAALRSLGLAVLATWVASLGNMVAVRNQRRGLPVVQSNALGMAYGTGFTVVAASLAGVQPSFDWSAAYIGSLFYLSLFATVIAFGAYLTLLGRIGADRAAYASVLFPIVALAISTVLEDYRWSAAALVGVATVLAGNLLVLMRTAEMRSATAPVSEANTRQS
ncbi:MAG: DMT family transporter [Acidiferrobacterales bacterium]|nr:DMT family transporter [Acidiferrobacterales bacterium]